MSCWELPHFLNVSGIDYEIREDFRAVLDILSAFNDDTLDDAEKNKIMIEILYTKIPPISLLKEASEKAIWFIDCGIEKEDAQNPRIMDWDKDSKIIFPAINKIAGFETRCKKEIHWWTFYGWFMEIDDGLFSQVLSIRQKISKGKKLEKWEREFLINNKELCDLKSDTDKFKEEYDFFSDMLKI